MPHMPTCPHAHTRQQPAGRKVVSAAAACQHTRCRCGVVRRRSDRLTQRAVDALSFLCRCFSLFSPRPVPLPGRPCLPQLPQLPAVLALPSLRAVHHAPALPLLPRHAAVGVIPLGAPPTRLHHPPARAAVLALALGQVQPVHGGGTEEGTEGNGERKEGRGRKTEAATDDCTVRRRRCANSGCQIDVRTAAFCVFTAAQAAPLLPFPATVPPTVFTKQPPTRSNSVHPPRAPRNAPAKQSKRDIGTKCEKMGS